MGSRSGLLSVPGGQHPRRADSPPEGFGAMDTLLPHGRIARHVGARIFTFPLFVQVLYTISQIFNMTPFVPQFSACFHLNTECIRTNLPYVQADMQRVQVNVSSVHGVNSSFDDVYGTRRPVRQGGGSALPRK